MANNIQSKIETFVKTHNPLLYILTPCYGSMCYVNYMVCLTDTIQLLNAHNIPVKVEYCRNDSLVPRARNNLIARAMSNSDMTHVLFIDTDITWKPIDVLKLLLSDKLFIGGVYPLKKLQWDRLEETDVINRWKKKKENTPHLASIPTSTFIENHLLNYNLNPLSNGESNKIENNLIKVRHMATGFMMLSRKTIEYMQTAFPSTKYTDDVGFLKPDENKHAYALFDCAIVNEHYLSEDWLFSERWINMGGDVYADITIDLTHTGIHDFKGSILSKLDINS